MSFQDNYTKTDTRPTDIIITTKRKKKKSKTEIRKENEEVLVVLTSPVCMVNHVRNKQNGTQTLVKTSLCKSFLFSSRFFRSYIK